MLLSTFMWCDDADIVRVSFGSHTSTSASLPTASVPLRGNRPKSLAGLVDVTATNVFRPMTPLLTPACHSTDMRSSIVGAPLGIFEKSSLPSSFWPLWLNEH